MKEREKSMSVKIKNVKTNRKGRDKNRQSVNGIVEERKKKRKDKDQ